MFHLRRNFLVATRRWQSLSTHMNGPREVSTSCLFTYRTFVEEQLEKNKVLTNIWPNLISVKLTYATDALNSLSITKVQKDEHNDDLIRVNFNSGRVLRFPQLYLRFHCPCPECYDEHSTGRTVRHIAWKTDEHVTSMEVTPKGTLKIVWSTGHLSEYAAAWLLARSFEEKERETWRKFCVLPKVQWSNEHKLPAFSFSKVMNSDDALLDWLLELETTGATLLQGVPQDPEQNVVLANRVGFVKRTFFGSVSNVFRTVNANNIAYTDNFLDLHNDLPYYDQYPGIICLNMIKQHGGVGGDSIVSDGLYCAEILRSQYPEAFRLLCTVNIYYGCWGVDRNSNEKVPYQYNRMRRSNVFTLGNDDEITEIRINNHVMNSHIDTDIEKATDFYRAVKLYFTLLYENSIQHKLQAGEMLVLDNTRCQHGRTRLEGESSRHLATSYLDWDEARCRRRVLAEKLGRKF